MHAYGGTPWNNDNEGITITGNSKNEVHKYTTMQKKADTKDYILYEKLFIILEAIGAAALTCFTGWVVVRRVGSLHKQFWSSQWRLCASLYACFASIKTFIWGKFNHLSFSPHPSRAFFLTAAFLLMTPLLFSVTQAHTLIFALSTPAGQLLPRLINTNRNFYQVLSFLLSHHPILIDPLFSFFLCIL